MNEDGDMMMMDVDQDDFEPTPLALPHQVQQQPDVHRVVSVNPEDMQRSERRGSHEVIGLERNSKPTTTTPDHHGDHLISDSDGAGDDDDEEDDDDFHSAASQHDDEFGIRPTSIDVIFGRGQPLRDHPGNMRMRDIIKRYTGQYRNANKQEKSQILKQIQAAIAGNGASRFLVPHNTQEPLEGCKPATAAEIRGKISHGLRDAIKVEDLLDSDFVHLWTDLPPASASTSVSMASNTTPLPFIMQQKQPGQGPTVTSPDISPLSFPVQSVTSSNMPPLDLGPPPPLMMMPPQHSLSFSSHGQFSTSNSINDNSMMMMSMGNGGVYPQYPMSPEQPQPQYPGSPQQYSLQQMQQMQQMQQQYSNSQLMAAMASGHNRTNSFLSGRGSSGMGPAIFHVSVPQGTGINGCIPTDKTDIDDDDSTLETAEKGLGGGLAGGMVVGMPPSSRRSHQHDEHAPSAIAVNAVLAPTSNNGCRKHYKLILAVAFTIIVVLAVLLALSYGPSLQGKDGSNSLPTSPTSSPSGGPTISTLKAIQEKGYLSCGVVNQQGYSSRNATTNVIEGFDVDLCRAIAAGIFGRERFDSVGSRNEPVEYVFVEFNERFRTLADGKIDILFGITTHTMERQVFEPTTQQGYSFSKPYLHNGMVFAGRPDYLACAEELNFTSTICQDTKVCVLDGTTHRVNVAELVPEQSIVVAPTFEAFYEIFLDGGCNVLAGEIFDVMWAGRNMSNYEVGTYVHSNEPIALVTRSGDSQFSDFCNWILQGLFSAEEVRTGGSLSELPLVPYFDGLDYMFHDAVTVVGDYGEIYTRHLERFAPRSQANQINTGTTPGMFALPFGELRPSVTPSIAGGKLEQIRNRGHLRCGITHGIVFAEFHNGEWSGLDVSFCEALSAAIFDGASHVQYTVTSPSDRFVALETGQVDVLARVTTITMERDVVEPTTGKGFYFSPPNFHDEIHFAGVPPYHNCADQLDTTSQGCQDLLVCVTTGTTQSELLKQVLSPTHILELSETSETIEGFVNGRCNTIFGGYIEVAPATVANAGYQGDYEVGPSAYSRESLALVTREDDVVWSNLVDWVVAATFYAEEQNITQATAQQMPRVNLFLPLVNDELFRNVIGAVGSYAEIWERSAARYGLERQGRNLPNTLPNLGPQLISDLLWDKPSHR